MVGARIVERKLEYEGTVIYCTLLFHNSVFLGRYEKKTYLNLLTPIFLVVL